jgi:hypothetical protein
MGKVLAFIRKGIAHYRILGYRAAPVQQKINKVPVNYAVQVGKGAGRIQREDDLGVIVFNFSQMSPSVSLKEHSFLR